MSTWWTREKMITRFTKRVKGNKVNSSGVEHPALFSYHSLYEVSFPNVQTEDLLVNVISESIIYQVNSEVHHYKVIKEISDHSADGSALDRSDGFIRSFEGNLHANNTTRGSKLEVEWNYVTLCWIPLKNIKASNHVELTEYAVANNIEYKLTLK